MSGRQEVSPELLREISASLENSKVLFSEPMSNHTSFRIGGPCDLLIMPRSHKDVVKAWVECRRLSVPCYIIGNGTNLLVRDGGIRGCAIKMAPGLSGVEINGKDSLRVKSGTLLSGLVKRAMEAGLSGLEFAVGIPGSVGGAISMNAGAYNGDISSLVERVLASDAQGKQFWLNDSEIKFSYRDSLFLQRDDLIVLEANIRLVPGDVKRISSLMAKNAQERARKQPLDLPSAGSAFRRPQGRYVGSMVEALGLKGFSYGGAQVSEKHAGFIVNSGNGTAADVLALMKIIQEKVKDAYGVELESEIVVIGEDLPGWDGKTAESDVSV